MYLRFECNTATREKCGKHTYDMLRARGVVHKMRKDNFAHNIYERTDRRMFQVYLTYLTHK